MGSKISSVQRTWKAPCPQCSWKKRKKPIWAVDPAEPKKQPRLLSLLSRKNQVSAALRRYLCMREILQKFSFPKGKLQYNNGEKIEKYEFGCSKDSKRKFSRTIPPPMKH